MEKYKTNKTKRKINKTNRGHTPPTSKSHLKTEIQDYSTKHLQTIPSE